MIKKYLLLLITLSLFSACRDIYEPDIELVDNSLVVEGLITNMPGRHLVKLSRSSAFGQSFRYDMVDGASVSITSSGGQSVFLTEGRAGHYYTPESFSGKAGESYVLHVETPEGDAYKSEPQLMMPPLQVENVSAEHGIRLFFLSSSMSSAITQQDVHGGKVFFTVTGNDRPKFRFTSHLLLDYIITYPGVFPTYDYCWIRRSIMDYMEKDIGESPGTGAALRHQVGYIPSLAKDLPYMGFPNYVTGPENTYFGSIRIILNYLYALNDDAYRFHDMRNKQLSDEGRFFDPIAAQLTGNIHAVNKPEEMVFGFFEASSVTYTPVRVRISPLELKAEIVELTDTMASTGCVFNEMPAFFTSNK